MRPVAITKVLAAAAANNICLSQTPGGAGALTLNGSTVSGGVATLDTQRVVLITSAGNDSARTFTVKGTDENGLAITESLAGGNIAAVSTVNNFKTVTSVSIDGAAAAGVTVGTSGVGASKPVPLDQRLTPANIGLIAEVTGTVNYDIQYTFDDVYDPSLASSLNWLSISALTGKTATTDGSLGVPASAVRTKINSGAGSVKLVVVQAGGHAVS